MSSGEVLDASFSTCRKLGVSLLQLTALPTAICLASVAFLTEYVFPALNVTKDPGSFFVQAGEMVGTLLLALFVGGPLAIIGLAMSSAISVHLTSGLLMGRPMDKAAALQSVRQNFPLIGKLMFRELLVSTSGILMAAAVLLAGGYAAMVTKQDDVIAGLIALLGILGLIAGFLVFLQVLATHSLAIPAALVEGLKPREAAKRSRFLLKGQAFVPSGISTIWSLYVALFFVVLALIFGVSLTFELFGIGELGNRFFPGTLVGHLWSVIIDLIPFYIILWAIIPAWAVTTTILYYERRIRLEGFDIEALASEISTRGRTNRFEI